MFGMVVLRVEWGGGSRLPEIERKISPRGWEYEGEGEAWGVIVWKYEEGEGTWTDMAAQSGYVCRLRYEGMSRRPQPGSWEWDQTKHWCTGRQ